MGTGVTLCGIGGVPLTPLPALPTGLCGFGAVPAAMRALMVALYGDPCGLGSSTGTVAKAASWVPCILVAKAALVCCAAALNLACSAWRRC